MKKLKYLFLFIIILLFGCKITQKSNTIPKNVLFVIDGIPSDKINVDKLDKNEIAEIIVLKGKSASDLYGKKAKNGAVLISSKKGAIRIYQKNLSSISPEYAEKLKLVKEEKELVYIIDNTPIIENHEVKLLHLKSNQIKEIKIIDSNATRINYGLDRKEGAVIIITK